MFEFARPEANRQQADGNMLYKQECIGREFDFFVPVLNNGSSLILFIFIIFFLGQMSCCEKKAIILACLKTRA